MYSHKRPSHLSSSAFISHVRNKQLSHLRSSAFISHVRHKQPSHLRSSAFISHEKPRTTLTSSALFSHVRLNSRISRICLHLTLSHESHHSYLAVFSYVTHTKPSSAPSHPSCVALCATIPHAAQRYCCIANNLVFSVHSHPSCNTTLLQHS